MTIAHEIFEKLQSLRGINRDITFRIFRENKLDVKYKGFSENIVALSLNRELPKHKRGPDFKEFEVKEVKVHFIKNGQMRTGGDTSISPYMECDKDFEKSNIYDKIKSLLLICVYNGIIIDVRIFDGEKHKEDMIVDYESIKKYKNLHRKSNKILVFKTRGNTIMLKGNSAINLSESIFYKDNIITDQEAYIHNLFDNKFQYYHQEDIIQTVINNASFSDLQLILKLGNIKMKEYVGFDINVELPF